MRAAEGTHSLALLVQDAPYRSREVRASLDVALAAAAMDFQLEIYFRGAAIMQLAREMDGETALLPAGYRAWAGLPELVDTGFFAEQGRLEQCANRGIELLLPVTGLSPEEWRRRWRLCDRAMVLYS